MVSSLFRTLFFLSACVFAIILLSSPAAGERDPFRKERLRKAPPSRVTRETLGERRAARGTPPAGPVAAAAEWEASEGVITLWHNADLILRLQEKNTVYIPVDDEGDKNAWMNWLSSNGIPLDHITFLFIPTDTIWTRDYGPWFVWDGNGTLGIVDYTAYPQSTYGPEDDLFPSRFAARYGIPLYDTGMSHVGGNWYPIGYGTAFSSTAVYTMNPYDPMAVTNQTIQNFLGVERYHTFIAAPWTIEHHDCWGKPANPETLVLVKYEETSAYYPYAERMVDLYETLESPWGRPYRIFRLPMFKMGSGWFEYKPYMNSLVSNDRVYVPVTYSPDDGEALAVYQAAFPGYEIVGVDHGGCGFNDAVHCRTRNFVKRDALRIYPYPPGDTEETTAAYEVRAEVIPPAGAALLPGYPRILWSDTGGAPFTPASMTPTGNPHEYAGWIPARPEGTTVSFYVEGADDGGHHGAFPLVAPAGLLSFQVRSDTQPPALTRLRAPRAAAAAAWPPSVRVLAKDDMAAPEVRVQYAVNGAPQPEVLLQREEGTFWYTGTLGAAPAIGDVVTLRVTASDGAATPNTSILPKFGKIYCPVAGPESVGVVDLSARPWTGPFVAEVLGGLGIPYHTYTTWPADWSAHDTWFVSLGIFADNHVLTPAEVDDLEAALNSGADLYLEGGDCWFYDPEGPRLCGLFGVDPVADGYDLEGALAGEKGTIMEGLFLAYAGENAFMDELGGLAGAEVVLRSTADGAGRAVLRDHGNHRTAAASFLLGGVQEEGWPQTGKELLLRYMEFFGFSRPSLLAEAHARPGAAVPVRLEGTAGDTYLLLASLGDFHLPGTGYGTLRLDPVYLFVLSQGLIPPEGFVEIPFLIPRDEGYVGYELHLQALAGSTLAPGQAALTNREILTVKRW